MKMDSKALIEKTEHNDYLLRIDGEEICYATSITQLLIYLTQFIEDLPKEPVVCEIKFNHFNNTLYGVVA